MNKTDEKSSLTKRISFRQMRFVVLMTFVTGVVFSTWQLWFDAGQERSTFTNNIERKLKAVEHSAAKAAFHVDPDLASQISQGLFYDKSVISVELIADLGSGGFSAPLVGDSVTLMESEKGFISEFILGGEQQFKLDLYLNEEPDRRLGILKVNAHPYIEAQDYLNRVLSTFALGFLRNGVIAALASLFFFYSVAVPLQRLIKDWESVDPLDPSPEQIREFESDRSDEFYRLVHQMRFVLQAMQQGVSDRNSMEQKLVEGNEELERRVQSRTYELEQAKLEAESATEAKSKFLAQVSHEIRNPMNAVFGLCHLLSKGDLTDKDRQYVENIHQASNNMLRLVDDILDFSRIESGRIQLEEIGFSLSSVTQSCYERFKHLAEEKNLAYQLNLPVNQHDICLGDPFRIEQVITNLITNAIKFTDQGFIILTLMIEAGDNDKLAITVNVEDSGIGLSDDEIVELFNYFSQANVSTSRRYGGSGLGLHICSDLAELMGGRVTVKSQKSRGSLFSFQCQLPKASTDDLTAVVQMEGLPETVYFSEQVTILVVDDSTINRKIVCELLEYPNVRTIEAQDGQKAIELAQSVKLDLILMDIQMPKLNGIDATKAIRQLFDDDDLPIIAVTANALDYDHQNALDVGVNTYIEKPIDPTSFIRTVQSFLPVACELTMLDGAVDRNSTLDEWTSKKTIVNFDRALQCVKGNKQTLVQIINLFINEHQSTPEQLTQLIGKKEYQKAYELCHKVNGSICNLGAQIAPLGKRVQAQLAKERLKAETWIDYKIKLTDAIEELARYQASEAALDLNTAQNTEMLSELSTEQSGVTQTQMNKYLQQLYLSLKEGNSNSEQLIDELVKGAHHELKQPLSEIKSDIVECDFDEAKQKLDRLDLCREA